MLKALCWIALFAAASGCAASLPHSAEWPIDDEQLAIHLGYQQGLSHGEIAVLLDWPVGTVKTHLARGKEKLRHLLAVWNPQT